jgi:hypothetical protein
MATASRRVYSPGGLPAGVFRKGDHCTAPRTSAPLDSGSSAGRESNLRDARVPSFRRSVALTITTGLLLPFFSALAGYACWEIFGTGRLPVSVFVERALWSSAYILFSSLFFLCWWPFAVYAAVVPSLYRQFSDEKSRRPWLPTVIGFIGLAAPAVRVWFSISFFRGPDAAFDALVALPSMYVTLLVAPLFQSLLAAIGLVVGWWINQVTSRSL